MQHVHGLAIRKSNAGKLEICFFLFLVPLISLEITAMDTVAFSVIPLYF